MQWLKVYRGFSSDPKLGLVAHKLALPRATINAVTLDLLEYAGGQMPRGTITGYDVEAAAYNLGLADTVINGIMDALQAKQFTDGARITNWEQYQSSDRTNAERQKRHREKQKQSSNGNVTDSNALPNADKKEKKTESKKEKKAPAVRFELPNWVPADAWARFKQMRERKKKPMTAHAMQMAVNKLWGFKQRGLDIEAVLDQSVFHAWDGLFEPKGVSNGNAGGSGNAGGKSDRAKSAIIGDAARRGDIEGGQQG